jgi:uncharacterized lipoprotein NlpE involved in copper resistance
MPPTELEIEGNLNATIAREITDATLSTDSEVYFDAIAPEATSPDTGENQISISASENAGRKENKGRSRIFFIKGIYSHLFQK